MIENSIAVTGALRAIANSSAILKSSFQFQFIIPRKSGARAWLEKTQPSSIHEWKMIEIRRNFVSVAFYLPCLIFNSVRLKKFVKENSIELIHVNDLYNLIAPIAAWLGCKVPYVCHVRSMPDGFPKWLFDLWLRIHLRYACKVIVVSEALKDRLPADDKIVCLYDGLNMEADKKDDYSNRSDQFHFLYLSNFIKGKGQDYALEAFKKIHSLLPRWHLRFVGGDMGLEQNRIYLTDLKEKALKYGLEKKITWEGFTDDVGNEYRQADIVINFSESESFSMTTLEASSNGRPVIVTACGGPAEIINDEVTGVIVENRNVEAMANAMLKLASSAELRIKMGLSAKLEIRNKFDLAVTSEKLRYVYTSCLQK